MGRFSEDMLRAKGGDAEALCRLLDTYGSHLTPLLRSRMNGVLRRRYDTIDLRQSIIVEVLRKLDCIEDRGERAFRSWLGVVARNKVRAKFRRLLKAGEVREAEWVGDLTPPESREDRPVEAASSTEDRVRLREAMQGLPARYQEILRLRGEDGQSHAEVAEWMELPGPDAARKLYARALVKLRTSLSGGSRPP